MVYFIECLCLNYVCALEGTIPYVFKLWFSAKSLTLGLYPKAKYEIVQQKISYCMSCRSAACKLLTKLMVHSIKLPTTKHKYCGWCRCIVKGYTFRVTHQVFVSEVTFE